MTKTRRFLSLAVAVVAAGCAHADDGATGPLPPNINLQLGGSITVVQGQTGSTQVTVLRQGGFAGEVALQALDLPPGVTAVFNPAIIPAGSENGTSTLTLTASATAPTGPRTFEVDASGGSGSNLNKAVAGNVTIQPSSGS